MTTHSTFVKGTIAAVTIAAATVLFSVNDNAAAAPLHFAGYAKKAVATMTQSASAGSQATATPNTPRQEGRGRGRPR